MCSQYFCKKQTNTSTITTTTTTTTITTTTTTTATATATATTTTTTTTTTTITTTTTNNYYESRKPLRTAHISKKDIQKRSDVSFILLFSSKDDGICLRVHSFFFRGGGGRK